MKRKYAVFCLLLLAAGALAEELVIFADFTVYNNGTVVPSQKIRLREGMPTLDVPEHGEYSVEVLNRFGIPVWNYPFNAYFSYEAGPPIGDPELCEEAARELEGIARVNCMGGAIETDNQLVSVQVPYTSDMRKIVVRKGLSVLFESPLLFCNHNKICDNQETVDSCTDDCKPYLPDGMCYTTNDNYCDPDCEAGDDTDCTLAGACGNGACDGNESKKACPVDCGGEMPVACGRADGLCDLTCGTDADCSLRYALVPLHAALLAVFVFALFVLVHLLTEKKKLTFQHIRPALCDKKSLFLAELLLVLVLSFVLGPVFDSSLHSALQQKGVLQPPAVRAAEMLPAGDDFVFIDYNKLSKSDTLKELLKSSYKPPIPLPEAGHSFVGVGGNDGVAPVLCGKFLVPKAQIIETFTVLFGTPAHVKEKEREIYVFESGNATHQLAFTYNKYLFGKSATRFNTLVSGATLYNRAPLAQAVDLLADSAWLAAKTDENSGKTIAISFDDKAPEDRLIELSLVYIAPPDILETVHQDLSAAFSDAELFSGTEISQKGNTLLMTTHLREGESATFADIFLKKLLQPLFGGENA